ncbi:MAG: UvrD-helicase domain-containing protein, partial [Thermaceae bacterium]|nr:UvrD-helicase domain-containing protein [Thermaceae bacterium]
MNFLIADTFTASLGRLTGEEQKAVKTTAFDLQLNPASPGHSFHKLDGAKDKHFWSVRVNRDLRIIVHRSRENMLLCYVGHHDDAYAWAERRRLETHPKTGAAQLVEIRERVEEIAASTYRPRAKSKPLLFASLSDDELLSYGVPPEWIADVRQADEDGLLALVNHLPGEAAEALLEVAIGGKPQVAQASIKPASPFDHPDAQRRFRFVDSLEELQRALDFPWERWAIFLHPDQRQMVERSYNGPVRVSGSAGTGKTVVALHRAAFLARHNPGARVLLTTFSPMLVADLEAKLRRLVSNEPQLAEQIEVKPFEDVICRLYRMQVSELRLAGEEDVWQALQLAAARVTGHHFTLQFLRAEWEQVVDAWQVETWEEYRKAPRLGRKTRLPEAQRRALWDILSAAKQELSQRGLTTLAGVCVRLTSHFSSNPPPFDFIVVDEAQDLAPMHLKLFGVLAGKRGDGLFFCGDLGQRIFQQPFSWKALGVDIRGRSKTLRINYRTSHQIRTRADRLLDNELSDVDGNLERRSGAISIFDGPDPELRSFDSEAEEIRAVGEWFRKLTSYGLKPGEFGVFVRSTRELPRAKRAVEDAGLAYVVLDDGARPEESQVSVGTMHLAKGLEFRAVVVMACDDEVIPSQERLSEVGDEADLDEVY